MRVLRRIADWIAGKTHLSSAINSHSTLVVIEQTYLLPRFRHQMSQDLAPVYVSGTVKLINNHSSRYPALKEPLSLSHSLTLFCLSPSLSLSLPLSPSRCLVSTSYSPSLCLHLTAFAAVTGRFGQPQAVQQNSASACCSCNKVFRFMFDSSSPERQEHKK